MNRKIVLTLLVLVILLLGLIAVQPVHSLSPKAIIIKSDGSVDPSSAPIQRNGENFTLSGNIESQVVIERNNIIFEGGDYMLGLRLT